MTAKTKIVLYNPRGSTFLPYDGPPMAILMVASLLDLERYDIKILDWHYDNVLQRLAEEGLDRFAESGLGLGADLHQHIPG